MSSGVINSGVVALVGSPNSGKTTLFNWLTGLRYNTVNYPGSTVEYSVGTTHSRYGEAVRLMDAPGVYSLFPKSPEEEITLKAILDHPTYGPAELVLSVVDATHLSRHLLTTKQLISAGFPTILAVTMIDLLREAGQKLDAEGLARELGCPVVLIEGQLGGGVVELVSKLHEFFQSGGKAVRLHSVGDWNRERIEQSIAETQDIERRVVSRTGIQKGLDSIARTARIDKYLLHPVFGIAIFLAIMSAVFTSIYWVAAPLMDFVDAGFSWVASEIINLNANPLLLDFFANGIVASFGAVLVFVPQIFILFMGIAILEDSGYLARSATIIDRPFRFFGLSGRSFVPLLSGFACAVPAMMAARSISSSRERWLTLF
ncbi:MAG: ferrous iron transporter B, partial [Bdellovibrionales bacterium]|nr:ferrous iron transporter B [Bdellovibrionales bacterium]